MKRFFSALMSAAIIFSILPQAVYSDEISVVAISTPEEFNEFSKKCVSDTYSKNMQAVIKNDIDFKDTDVIPVEIFCGELDGGGYTLKNICLDFDGNNKGLFVRCGSGAVIKNLNVNAEIMAKNEDEQEASAKNMLGKIFKNIGVKNEVSENYIEVVGGIVGINEGQMNTCTFKGSVKGESTVGGLVGYNRNLGMIENCVNEAAVQGDLYVGGIAGKNDGYIKTGENKGKINTNANESSSGVGGVAGMSGGVINGTANTGEVGYLNLGDNIGGIAGVQSGLITECTNSAKVYGRKGVGGIVGRFEPYNNISKETIKEDVKNNIEDIHVDLDKAKEDIKSLPQDWKDDIKDLAKNLADVGLGDGLGFSKLSDNVSRLTDSMVDNTNQISSSTSDMLGSAQKAIDKASGNNSIKQASDALSDLSKSIGDKIDGADTDGIGENVRNVLSGLSDVNDETKSTLKTLDKTLNETLSFITDNEGSLEDVMNNTVDFLDKATTALENGDKNAEESLEDLRDRLDHLQDDCIDPLTKNLKQTHKALNAAINQIQSSFADSADSIAQVMQDLDKLIKRRIDKLEKLDAKIDKIKETIDNIINKHRPGTKPTESARLFTTVYADDDEEDDKKDENEPQSVDIPLLRPVAGIWSEDAVVKFSYNEGEINGVEYTGGIAGAVGMESAIKSGENAQSADTDMLGLDGFVKAVISGCINDGKILSKNGNGGGISGYSTIGIIRESIGGGKIESSDGGYVGGISGFSKGFIERCIGFADLEAKKNTGGIAASCEHIKLCYAFPRIYKASEHIGAIAGVNSGDIEKNYFINEGLGGIDSADYDGRAVALSKDDMTADGVIPYLMDGFISDDWYMAEGSVCLPQIRAIAENECETIGAFLRTKSDDYAKLLFKVVFTDDEDNEIKSFTAPYGTVIAEDEIPELPEKDGYTPQWDNDVTKPIVRNTVFKCVFDNATTTISSGEEPPIILVEGNFHSDAKLVVENLSSDNISFSNYRVKKGYTISSTDDYNGKVTVRVRDEKKKCRAIGVMGSEGVQTIQSHRDGSYMVFELDSMGGFYVLTGKLNPLWLLLWLLILAAVGFGAFLAHKRLKPVRKKIIDKIKYLEPPEWETDLSDAEENAQESTDADIDKNEKSEAENESSEAENEENKNSEPDTENDKIQNPAAELPDDNINTDNSESEEAALKDENTDEVNRNKD